MPSTHACAAPRDPAQRGLSLIEVMIALVLLGMAITLLATALARSMASVVESRLDLLAATAQRSRIEALRALPADRCTAPLAGASMPGPGLAERWAARQSGTSLEVVDSLVRVPDGPRPARTLSARLPCR